MSKAEKSGDEYLFEIWAFLTSSAKGCLWEPKLYGPLRLLTTFSKIALLPDYAPCLKRDEFLLNLREEIEEKSSPNFRAGKIRTAHQRPQHKTR